MPRLIPCSSCHSHVMVDARECPHCGASLRTTTALRAPAVLMGLALTACPVGEPEYGVADTGEPTTTGRDTETISDSSSTGGSGSGSSGAGSSTGMTDDGTSSGTSTEGSTSLGEPEYGVAETSTGASTEGSTSLGEPEYGVAETAEG